MIRKTKIIATLMVITLLLTLVTACQKPAEEDLVQPEIINVSYSLRPINVPTIVALDKKFFEEDFSKEAIEVKWYELEGPATVEALAAKSVDIATSLNYVSAIITKANGKDIKVIANFSKFPKGIGLVARTDKDITTAKDLLGKKIALQTGTMLHEMLIRLLEQNNIDINSVEIVGMPSPDAANAVVQGQVDAAIIPEPLLTKTISSGEVKLLQTAEDLILGQSFIAVRTEFLTQYPELVKKFLQLHQYTLNWSDLNKEDALLLASETIQMPQQMVEKLYPKFDFTLQITEADIENLKNSARFLQDWGFIKKNIDIESLVEDLIDISYLP